MRKIDENYESWMKGLTTKSDKIRVLARHGVATADIARYLDIRYQHARNVLLRCGLHAPQSAVERSKEALPATAAEHAWVDLSNDGSLRIPSELLNAAGLELGSSVHVRVGKDCLEVMSDAAALKRAQQIVSAYVPPGVSLVDELIAERRLESRREAEEAA
jgi:hypothetical protein